jgi:hypothetical protein
MASKNKVSCPFCPKLFHPNSLKRHIGICKGRNSRRRHRNDQDSISPVSEDQVDQGHESDAESDGSNKSDSEVEEVFVLYEFYFTFLSRNYQLGCGRLK